MSTQGQTPIWGIGKHGDPFVPDHGDVDYRALAAQLADCLQVTCQCIESLDYFGMLDKFREIEGGDVAVRSAASNGRDALAAARKAGIL